MGWEKHRLWGSQALLLSRRIIPALLELWDTGTRGRDARVLAGCAGRKVPLYYTMPCLVEHVPAVTAFRTPITYAPDFDPEFRFALGSGFQPPEALPGTLTLREGKCLFGFAAGRRVLELRTASGRATVCLAQSAAAVTTLSVAGPLAAVE